MAKISKTGYLLIAIPLILSACAGDTVGTKYVEFAKCLTAQGVKMYGTYWCPHCQKQKAAFGQQGFAQINYVECDAKGKNGNPDLCTSKGIDGYPTWEFSNGLRIVGEITFEMLSEKSGCPLPKEEPTTNPTSNGSADSKNPK